MKEPQTRYNVVLCILCRWLYSVVNPNETEKLRNASDAFPLSWPFLVWIFTLVNLIVECSMLCLFAQQIIGLKLLVFSHRWHTLTEINTHTHTQSNKRNTITLNSAVNDFCEFFSFLFDLIKRQLQTHIRTPTICCFASISLHKLSGINSWWHYSLRILVWRTHMKQVNWQMKKKPPGKSLNQRFDFWKWYQRDSFQSHWFAIKHRFVGSFSINLI